MTPIDILEHENFDAFFDEALKEAVASRRSGVVYKRSAYESLQEKGVFSNRKLRKELIYSCALKKSNLSRKERDFLERLTIVAGAKVIAQLTKERNEKAKRTRMGEERSPKEDR